MLFTSSARKWLLMSLVWLLPVMFLAWFGYGSDEDAWIVGQEGLTIIQTGKYSISRSTGFPLHELLCAPLSYLGSWYACNALCIAFGLGCIYFLYLLNKTNAIQHTAWVILGFVFLPQIIINSSSTLDYIPSLFCWLGMYYHFLKKNYYYAALWAGLACGFRPSNGAFILPICFILLKEKNYTLAIKTFFTALVSGMLAYSPVLIHYGILDPTREVDIEWKQNLLIGGYQFLILFGIWQSAALIVFFIVKLKTIRSLVVSDNSVLFHVISILFWLCFFFGITSSESEYLFPIIPSVFFLLDRISTSRQMAVIAILLFSYNVVSLEVLGGESGNRKIAPRITWGLTIRDYQDRKFKLWYRNACTDLTCQNKTLLMFGSAYVLANNPEWEILSNHSNIIKQKKGNLYLSERILDTTQLKALRNEGIRLYVWDKRKWEYLRLSVPNWDQYVEVVYDLPAFVKKPQEGELMQ